MAESQTSLATRRKIAVIESAREYVEGVKWRLIEEKRTLVGAAPGTSASITKTIDALETTRQCLSHDIMRLRRSLD